MRWLLLFVLICYIICCHAQGYDQNQILATYYGIPKDTIKKYFRFKDSATVMTARLDFVQFNDLRDTSANKEYQLCGVICHNQLTGNNTVCGIRRKTMLYDAYNVRDAFRSEEIVRVPDNKYLREHVQYYDTFFNKSVKRRPIDVFAERNRGIAMKLSSILNDLPLLVKTKLTRPVVDSIFRSFIGCYEFLFEKALVIDKDGWIDINGRTVIDNFSSAKNKDHERRRGFISEARAAALVKLDKMHLHRHTSFLYSTWSKLLHGDGLILIIVNDNLPESFSHLNFYSKYNYEPIMYDVQIYSENFIEKRPFEHDY
jgi:hypothetical protein